MGMRARRGRRGWRKPARRATPGRPKRTRAELRLVCVLAGVSRVCPAAVRLRSTLSASSGRAIETAARRHRDRCPIAGLRPLAGRVLGTSSRVKRERGAAAGWESSRRRQRRRRVTAVKRHHRPCRGEQRSYSPRSARHLTRRDLRDTRRPGWSERWPGAGRVRARVRLATMTTACDDEARLHQS